MKRRRDSAPTCTSTMRVKPAARKERISATWRWRSGPHFLLHSTDNLYAPSLRRRGVDERRDALVTSSSTRSEEPMSTYAEIDATLTAPGQFFEIDEIEIRGVPTRVWKSTPRSLRVVLEQSALRVATLRSSCSVTSASLTPNTTLASRRLPGGSSTTSACLPATGWSSRCATIPSGRSRSSPRPRSAQLRCRSTRGGPARSSRSGSRTPVRVSWSPTEHAGRGWPTRWKGCRSTRSSVFASTTVLTARRCLRGSCRWSPQVGESARFPRSRSHRTTTPRSSTRRGRPVARKASSAPTATSAPTS